MASKIKGASVASKTIFVGTLIAIAILFAMMILFSLLHYKNRKLFLEDRIKSEIESIELFLGESYILGDFISIRRYLDSYAKLNNWQYGKFTDNLGTLIWDYNSDSTAKEVAEYSSEIKAASIGKIGLLNFKKDLSKENERGDSQLMLALLGFSIIGVLGLVVQNMSLLRVLRPISELTTDLRSEAGLLGIHLKDSQGKDDVLLIKEWFVQITNSWREHKDFAAQQSHYLGMAQIASQVAHDIRSPLSALNLVVSTLTNLPEEKRILIRSSVNRINDIANDLLGKSKDHFAMNIEKGLLKKSNAQIEMLSALVDLLVSEKRIQIRDKINIDIELDLSNSYGAFVEIDPAEFKRALSNLINNSIEALSDVASGKVKVQVRYFPQSSEITICDNGKGIDPEILPHLGKQGLSHGKKGSLSGNGLGLYHARKTIESTGGSFKIDSTLNVGTTVSLIIPNAPRPDWFIDTLTITQDQTVIICDDDSSIHELWKGRFNNIKGNTERLAILHFSSADQFSTWQRQNPRIPNARYLMDFELLGSSKSGLDLIEEFELNNQSILVSSRYEEDAIKQRCLRIGVKIIPKAMSGFISLKVLPTPNFWDCILIDDDPLIRATWEIGAKMKGKTFLSFALVEDFWNISMGIDKSSPIFIDVNLSINIRGEAIARDLVQFGFTNVSLATGFEKSEIDSKLFAGPVVGKDFPF